VAVLAQEHGEKGNLQAAGSQRQDLRGFRFVMLNVVDSSGVMAAEWEYRQRGVECEGREAGKEITTRDLSGFSAEEE
jgi:hypothetical protein